MNRYTIMLSPVAARQLDAMDERQKKNMVEALRALEEEPKRKRAGADIKKLSGIGGKKDLYRLRVGKYRVIYEVSEGKVWVSEIVKRGSAYRFIFDII